MKNRIAAVALLLGTAGAAQAAMVTVNAQYRVDFASNTVDAAIGLPTGSSFLVSATFDDVNLVNNELTIAAGSPTDSFTLNFGNYSFNAASDNFGGPLIQTSVSPAGLTLSGLLFETLFNIGTGPGAGDYLLSFSGNSFQLTPSGNTSDFAASGVQVVPLPAVLPLLLAGLGFFGVMSRRKKRPD
ncbi:MAG: VPLPA-CTERM sorting domain-containing protein [Cytophagales bacterium]|nr:VPLPA-CTERM sorting domain-containing protein [Rhizobacter sp.]